VNLGVTPKGARKWWLGELSRIAKERNVELTELNATPKLIAELESLIQKGELNDKLARTALLGVLETGHTLTDVIQDQDLRLVQNLDSVSESVAEALTANPEVAAKLKAGDLKPLGVIIGSVMKATGGKIDAGQIHQAILDQIKN
jgi:aspartyl-tRNA(Asn)/glutamyl-tRNA(Gln) amidotransferase subunit B